MFSMVHGNIVPKTHTDKKNKHKRLQTKAHTDIYTARRCFYFFTQIYLISHNKILYLLIHPSFDSAFYSTEVSH